jgi:hypothetical protein
MTATSPAGDQPSGLTLAQLAASQFSYHVRMAAVFAVAGQSEESAAEAVLAWTMLSRQWPGAADAASAVGAELVDARVAALSETSRAAALARAHGLALDIEAHYVSVGCVGEAALYAEVADAVADVGADLAAR